MVRFIMIKCRPKRSREQAFTFQYGQIYYLAEKPRGEAVRQIYIPIWLDLLFKSECKANNHNRHLHSNMVRFIINAEIFGYRPVYDIYIPIWLDLLFVYQTIIACQTHSFTFQYGQIYYLWITYPERTVIVIYIPIWLDLL